MPFPRIGLALSLVLTVLVGATLWMPSGVHAQSPSASSAEGGSLSVDPTFSPSPEGASSAASSTDAAASDAASAVSNEPVPPLQGAFGALKLGNDVTVLLSVLIGVAVFVWQRRLFHYAPKAKGYGTAIGVMVVLYVLLNWVFLSHDGSTCASAILAYGKDGSEYADTCRLAREGAANFGGLVSLYRQLFVANAIEYVIPLGPTAVHVLSFVSLFLGTTMLYFVLVPVGKKLFVRS